MHTLNVKREIYLLSDYP